MPKVSDMIQSKFLRKEDVDDELVVTMRAVKLEEMPGDGREERWVLYFKELAKGLVLNATMIRVLEKNYGQHSDDWTGRKATLFVDETVQFKGQIVGGLRLRPMRSTKPPGAGAPAVPITPAAAPAAPDELDDEVPFN
jgi:hypothetical protein